MELETILMLIFAGLLAVFTTLLFFATREYTKTTEKLLKQSRNAFLADMTIRISQYIAELHYRKGPGKGPAVSEKLKDLVDEIKTVPYLVGISAAFETIDKEINKNFEEVIKKFLKYYTKSHNEILEKIKEKKDKIKET